MGITQGFLGGLAAGNDILRTQQIGQHLAENQRQFDLTRQDQRRQMIFSAAQQGMQHFRDSTMALRASGVSDEVIQQNIQRYQLEFDRLAEMSSLFGTDEGTLLKAGFAQAVDEVKSAPTPEVMAATAGRAAAAQEQATAQALGIQPKSVMEQQVAQSSMAVNQAQIRQVDALIEKYRAEAKYTLAQAEGEGRKSDLLDESGNVKNEVSAELRRQATTLVNPNAAVNPQTGMIQGLSPEDAVNAQRLSVAAEELIRSGQVRGASEAILQASGVIELPQRDAEVPLTPEKRQGLLDQNVEIDLATRSAQQLLNQIGIGTGALSMGKAGLDATLGQIASLFGREGALFPDNNDAREAIARFAKELETSFVNNPRFPEGERKQVQALLPNIYNPFTNPGAAKDDMVTLFAFLKAKREQNERLLSGKGVEPVQIQRPGSTPTSPQAGEQGLTATNPQTGERVIYRNGQWEPLQ